MKRTKGSRPTNAQLVRELRATSNALRSAQRRLSEAEERADHWEAIAESLRQGRLALHSEEWEDWAIGVLAHVGTSAKSPVEMRRQIGLMAIRSAPGSDVTKWRAGRKNGRLIYRNSTCVGMLDSAEMVTELLIQEKRP